MKLSILIQQCIYRANNPKQSESTITLENDTLLAFENKNGARVYAHNKVGALDKIASLAIRTQTASGTEESFSLQAKLIKQIAEAFKTSYPKEISKLAASDQAALATELTSATTAEFMLPPIITVNPYHTFGSPRSVASEPAPAVGHQSSPTVSSRSF
ncbi:MAG: hypothetical protein P1U40_05000 [Coxiellaceae bacterium]|nr:hypothetical protein [Coxiellaceae bacterium]